MPIDLGGPTSWDVAYEDLLHVVRDTYRNTPKPPGTFGQSVENTFRFEYHREIAVVNAVMASLQRNGYGVFPLPSAAKAT